MPKGNLLQPHLPPFVYGMFAGVDIKNSQEFTCLYDMPRKSLAICILNISSLSLFHSRQGLLCSRQVLSSQLNRQRLCLMSDS